MFKFNSIFENPLSSNENNRKKEKDNKDNKENKKSENSLSRKIGDGLARYIVQNFLSNSRLEYAKPLLFLQNRKAEIAKNREASKMLSVEKGGPTPEQIYYSALEVARKLGWKEKLPDNDDLQLRENPAPSSPENSIPLFITNRLRHDLKSYGVTDEEIDKLKPDKAWDLLQQKTLSQEIKEPKEKTYTFKEIENDFSLLQRMWEEAYERMDAINESKRTSEILDITGKTSDDPKPLEEYLQNNKLKISPEENFFIQISIQLKKFRNKAKDLIFEGVQSSSSQDSSVTKDEFDIFIDSGKVPENVLQKIAQKVINGNQMSREELAVYAEHSKEVESMLRNG